MARPEAFGILADEVDGQDVRAVYGKTRPLVELARNGEGPAFLLCNTYRTHGHHVGDINREYYRSKEEEREWKGNQDPLKILGEWLLQQQMASAEAMESIHRKVTEEAAEAVRFALAAPYPDLSGD